MVETDAHQPSEPETGGSGLVGRAHATVVRLRARAFRRRGRGRKSLKSEDVTVVDQPMLKRAVAGRLAGQLHGVV